LNLTGWAIESDTPVNPNLTGVIDQCVRFEKMTDEK
jgi:hypothetical protein